MAVRPRVNQFFTDEYRLVQVISIEGKYVTVEDCFETGTFTHMRVARLMHGNWRRVTKARLRAS